MQTLFPRRSGHVARRLLLSVWFLVSGLFAQAPQGEIDLQVKDPSGAPMQATGRIEGLRAGVARDFQTDAQGNASLSSLPLGRYRIQISKSGFTTQTVTIDLRSAAAITRVMNMEIGAQAANVNVVSETPLAGTDLNIDQIAAPVQTATATDIQSSGALDLGDFLNRRLNGVFVNEMAENPFQPDVNFRGYTASPLLGTPAGISVYVDGVRQNQPFGDVVSWDLIPKDSISEMALIPGSDPLYGLNTLGGAILCHYQERAHQPRHCRACFIRRQRTQRSGRRVGRWRRDRFQLVRFWPRISRIGMALRLGVRYTPGIRASGLAHEQNRSRAYHVIRL